MKAKTFFLCGVLICSAAFSFAQVLKVESNGNITTKRDLAVNGSITVGANRHVKLHTSGIYIDYYGGGPGGGIVSKLSSAVGSECIGVHGEVVGGGGTSAKRIGVLGYAHNSSNATAIGVLGVVEPSGNRIAVAGLIGSRYTYVMFDAGGQLYAGYFGGPVKVAGGLTASIVATSSDERLKKNMLSLGNEKVLNKLMLLKPIAYNFKQLEREADSVNGKGEKVKFTVKRYDEKSQEFQKKHYGLVAQELQKVYPDLVYEDGDYLAVNYVELVPLLLQAVQEQQTAIQEQQATIEQQQIAIADLQRRLPDYGVVTPSVNSSSLTIEKTAQLFQNTPNPFSERTEISYFLPDDVQKASLYVYDMNGRQMMQLPLTQKGSASVVVAGSQLQAGMYLYTLIADGKEVDTKRMILTK